MTEALERAEGPSAHDIMRGVVPAPSRHDPHPFLPLIALLELLCPVTPDLREPDEGLDAEDDRYAGMLWSACAIRDRLLPSTCDLAMARIQVATLSAAAAALAKRLDAEPMSILDDSAERAVTGTVGLAQIADVCLAGCGDRDALVRLAEAAETCAALCASGYQAFATGARHVLATQKDLGEWRPGQPPIPVIGTAIQVGRNALARLEHETGRAKAQPTHAEEIDDDRAGIVRHGTPGPHADFSPVELAVSRQLARTLDAVPGLRQALAERDVVVTVDVPEALSLGALDGVPGVALGLPTGLRRHLVKDAPKGSDRDRRAREFLAMLRHPGAILCLSPDAASHLPSAALLAAEHRLTLSPIDASDVAAAIRSTTGAACSPGDRRALDGLRISAEHLAVAVRPGRAPADCVAHLVRLAAPPAPTGRGRDITLDELHGCREVVAWGREVIRDLQAWRDGAPWSSVASGALMAGAPGTGKTLAAQALATTAGIPLLAASLAQWQSVGSAHLGTTLKAMRETFAEAKALAAGKRGCVLLVDECDVFVDRRTVRHAHADYVLEIVNAFLECLDGAGGREGVVVIGTTNDANRVDPAVRRPGRLGRHIEIGLPDAGERVAMLRVRLGDDLPDADLLPVAYRTERATGAMIEALVEDARRRARHAGRPLALDDLLAVAGAGDEATPAGVLDRIAVHEAGHALMAWLEQPGREMVLALQTRGDDRGWMECRDAHQGILTRAAVEDRVRIMLGGRAAEETLLDSASSGARQDLLTATRMAVGLIGEWGLGGRGLVAVEQEPAMALATDPLLRRDAQELLDRLYGETLAAVRRHAGAVRRVADALVERRRLDGDEVARLVAEPVTIR